MSTTIADPRPRAESTEQGPRIHGWRCASCDHPATQEMLRCPLCRGEMTEAEFATAGEVWASTCLRVRVPGHQPPFAVAYLVLDEQGPRVLVHTPGDEPLAPGTRARITAVSDEGDLVATSIEEESA